MFTSFILLLFLLSKMIIRAADAVCMCQFAFQFFLSITNDLIKIIVIRWFPLRNILANSLYDLLHECVFGRSYGSKNQDFWRF